MDMWVKKNVIMYWFIVNNYCEFVNDLICISILYIIREKSVYEEFILLLGVLFKFID